MESNENNENIMNPKINDNNEVNITKASNILIDQLYLLMKSNDFTIGDVVSESMVMVGAVSIFNIFTLLLLKYLQFEKAYETTATSVYTSIMCLAMLPEYQDKLYDELHAVIPDKNVEITHDDLQNVNYLECVVNEAMRLLTPVPIVARMCTDDVDIGNGIILPKGVQIAIDIFNLHRDEKIWGPDSKSFNPDHFAKANLANKHPYSFIPFTKGIRNCIGVYILEF